MSKLPFVIAMDQGLYEKHGLNVELRVPTPESDGQLVSFGNFWGRLAVRLRIVERGQDDITINGGNPMIVRTSQEGPAARKIMIGATDCVLRAHVIARKGVASLDELKGGRIGVSALGSTAGFHALLLAERMHWDPMQDVSIITGHEDVAALLDGRLDALIGYEGEFADAIKNDLPILLDMNDWGGSIAGNSINVSPDWLEDPVHREAASRFLKATAEAISVLHQKPEIAHDALKEWYGIADTQRVQIFFERGKWIPRKPYPCYDGIEKGFALYDSHEMRRYKPTDFYDDSVMREVDASGFFDGLYPDKGTSPSAVLNGYKLEQE